MVLDRPRTAAGGGGKLPSSPTILRYIMSKTLSDYITRVKELCQDNCGATSIALVKATGGALAAGTLNVRVSVLTEFGESLPCARVSLAVAANDKVTIGIVNIPASRGYKVYASMGAAAETLQGMAALSQGPSSFVLSAVATGSAMPTEDTSTVYLALDTYERNLEAAARRYSCNEPLQKSADVVLVTNDLSYALPLDWVDGFSVVENLRYPSTALPAEYLEPENDYTVENGELVLRRTTNGTAKLYYTIPHSLGATVTIPDVDFDGVCYLAAAESCKVIATKYGHTSNTTIAADTVDFRQRSTDFRTLAKDYEAEANRLLGTPNGAKPHGARANWAYYKNHGEVISL